MSSPYVQLVVTFVVVFLVPGTNGTLLGLGAGGSRPSNIPIIDRQVEVVLRYLRDLEWVEDAVR
jgi:hypothetical protein